MGHVRLGVLPKSRKWRQVVEQLRLGADTGIVAAATADAAEASLKRASDDPAFLHAFWLLTQVPLAARGPTFEKDLRRLGLRISDQPSLLEVTAAVEQATAYWNAHRHPFRWGHRRRHQPRRQPGIARLPIAA